MKALSFIVLLVSLLPLSGCLLDDSGNASPAGPEFTGPLTVSSNFQGQVYTSELLYLSFSQPSDTQALTFNTTSGPCTGAIQLTLNNFVSCEALTYVASDHQFLELEVKDFQANVNYQLRVSAGIQSNFNNALEQDYETVFTTLASAGLLITEIAAAPSVASLNWFEVYNRTSHTINLQDYTLKAPVAIGNCTPECDLTFDYGYRFSLPNKEIEPGQYMIIRAQHWQEIYSDNASMIYLGDNNVHLYWQSFGYLELIKNSSNKTEDFVLFGNSGSEAMAQPTTPGAWLGGPTIDLPYENEFEYRTSLKRHVKAVDSNEAGDWSLTNFQTPAGPNDVACIEDLDKDGLPDCSEQEGTSYGGIDIYALGARVNQPDIFIEVDYMESADVGVKPRKEALQKVVDVFAKQNIAVHFDVGDLYDENAGINLSNFDLGGGNQVVFQTGVTFYPEEGSGIASLYDVKRMNMDNARLSIFHYMLMAYSQQADGLGDGLGIAELDANDMIITLGNLGLSSVGQRNINELINIQATTIMHELGHNLGLMHGGHEDTNSKPNYLSVMNYLYSYAGLPEIGNNEGDRYYWENCPGYDDGLSNSLDTDPALFPLDFSHGQSSPLNETQIYENAGLLRVNSNPVDFNCNESFESTPYQLDVNNDTAHTILRDHDDWGSLELRFQRDYHSHANLDEPSFDSGVNTYSAQRSVVNETSKADAGFHSRLHHFKSEKASKVYQ